VNVFHLRVDLVCLRLMISMIVVCLGIFANSSFSYFRRWEA